MNAGVDPVAAFFDAVTRQDWDGLATTCEPDVVVWQNLTGATRDLSGLLKFLHGIGRRYGSLSYGDVRRIDGASAVTVLQTIHFADRPDLAVAACMVCHLSSNGLIARIDEYMDSAAFAS